MSSISAVILAGGMGTRLSPLTESMPKPKLKILGASVIENVFSVLSKTGVKSAVVTTMYKPEQVETLGNKVCGVDVSYVREIKPLGTAGAVKNAFDGKSDSVLVLSGDGVCDFDLQKAIDFHRDKNADVTIVTYRSENPLEYGVVLTDNDGRIKNFVEKPSWQKVRSCRINTGIYIINRDILDLIPHGKEYDFSKQLFAHLLGENRRMYAIELDGYWCDIGNLDEYFACIASALDGRIRGISADGLTYSQLREAGVDFEIPVYVDKSAKIGRNVHLGAYTSVGRNVKISNGTTVECSVISDGVVIGDGCGVYGSIVGEGTELSGNCVISEGCVIGGKSTLGEGVILRKYTRLHSNTVLSEGENMMVSFKNKHGGLFGENGIFCGDGGLGSEYFTRLGYSMGLVLTQLKSTGGDCPRLGIMTDFGIDSTLVATSVVCGAKSSGIHVYDFGKGYESLCRYCAVSFIADVTLFVYRTGGNISIKMFDAYSVPVSSTFEKLLEKTFFADPEYERPSNLFEAASLSGMGILYYGELIKSARDSAGSDGLSGFTCYVESDGVPHDIAPANLLISAISELGGSVAKKPGAYPKLFVSPDGTNAYCEQGIVGADFPHIGAILIDRASEKLKKLALDYTSPEVFRVIAKKRGIEVLNYSVSDGILTKATRQDMYSELWLSDGLFAALRLCIELHKSKSALSQLMDGIPEFVTYTDVFLGTKKRAGIMEKLSSLDKCENGSERDGIKLTLADGTVTVIPGRVTGFKIISEARSAEAAKELCRRIEDVIKEG